MQITICSKIKAYLHNFMPVATGVTFSESCDSYSYSLVTCLMYYYFLPKWTALFFSFSLYIHELYLIAITLNMPNYICIVHCFVWGVFCFYYSSSWFVGVLFFIIFPVAIAQCTWIAGIIFYKYQSVLINLNLIWWNINPVSACCIWILHPLTG